MQIEIDNNITVKPVHFKLGAHEYHFFSPVPSAWLMIWMAFGASTTNKNPPRISQTSSGTVETPRPCPAMACKMRMASSTSVLRKNTHATTTASIVAPHPNGRDIKDGILNPRPV